MNGNNGLSLRQRLALLNGGVDLDHVGLDRDQDEDGEHIFLDPNLVRLIMGLDQLDLPPDLPHADEDPLVGFMPEEFLSQVGLSDTPLTKALKGGHFAQAERLILDNRDVDFLNDGVHSCTPLNLSLTGKQSYSQKPRNLRIAKLLIEHGANPNFRIPVHDGVVDVMTSMPEAPMEILIQYYFDLLKTFKHDKMADGSSVLNICTDELDEDLLDTIGLNGEENPTSEILMEHTKQLIDVFLDHGADVNLQSNQSGRTIFHVALCAEVTDLDLIEKMITLGALVNLTDVHGSTPFMDVLCSVSQSSAVDIFRKLQDMGKHVLIDAQNCSGESALWRSLNHGHVAGSRLLLQEGAISSTSARVQLVRPKRPSGRFRFFHRRPTKLITSLPAILAPILGNSPLKRGSKNRSRFSAKRCDNIIREQIGPLVDERWFCTDEVEKAIRDLLMSNTEFGHLTKPKVFQDLALVPLLFGDVSAGLRQKCIRKIVYSVFFEKRPEAVLKSLMAMVKAEESKKSKKVSVVKSKDDKPWVDIESGVTDVAMSGVSAVMSDTSPAPAASRPSTSTTTNRSLHTMLNGLALSEPEMRYSTSTPQPLRPRRLLQRRQRRPGRTLYGGSQNLIDDNWSLRQNPSYAATTRAGATTTRRRRRETVPTTSATTEEIEIEVSLNMAAALSPAAATADDDDDNNISLVGGPTVIRIHRLLRETNDMLQRLQNDFETSMRHHQLSTDDLVPTGSGGLLSTSGDISSTSDDDEAAAEVTRPRRVRRRPRRQHEPQRWRELQSDLALHGINLVFPEGDSEVERMTSSLPVAESPLAPEMRPESTFMSTVEVVRAVTKEDVSTQTSDMLANTVAQLCNDVDDVIAKTEAMLATGPTEGADAILNSLAEADSAFAKVCSGGGTSPELVSDSEHLNSLDTVHMSIDAANAKTSAMSESDHQVIMASLAEADSAFEEVYNKATTSGHDSQPMDLPEELDAVHRKRVQDQQDRFQVLAPGVVIMRDLQSSSEDEEFGSDNLTSTGSEMSTSVFHSTEDDLNEEDSKYQPSPTDESWGGGPFSLRQTLLAEARMGVRRSNSVCSFSAPITEETLIERMDTSLVTLLAKHIGVPPGLSSCLELEIARLQLLLAVHNHHSIKCDQGCEGDDSTSSDGDDDDDDTTESGESSWEFESLSSAFSNGASDQTDHYLSSSLDSDNASDEASSRPPYIPSIPARPRTLTSSSSSDESCGEDEAGNIGLDFRLGHLDDGDSVEAVDGISEEPDLFDDEDHDWLTVVGHSEHGATERFVRDQVVDERFDESTDSDTDDTEGADGNVLRHEVGHDDESDDHHSHGHRRGTLV